MTTAHMMGIDQLRRAVALFGGCRESFAQRFSATELVQLWRMYRASEWDFAPDQWSEEQVAAALEGTPPRWDAP